MANYYASCRSNYFKVKDEQAFMEWAKAIPDIDVHKQDELFCLLGCNSDGSGWPCYRETENGEDQEFSIDEELFPHLAEGEVAVLMEIGAEKLRYLVGYATAVSWTGETTSISISDIYSQAESLFIGCNPITTCEY